MNVVDLTGMEGFLAYCVLILIIVIIVVIQKNKKKKLDDLRVKLLMMNNNETKQEILSQTAVEPSEKLPYRKKLLLTKNEYWVYKSLKETADKYGFTVLAKVRFADLVEVSSEADKSEYMKFFGKIKSKHIDFMLCKKANLYPELLIEVNDNSHKVEDRIKRDDFIKNVAEKVGYKTIFVNGTQNLEETVIKAMGIETANNNDPPVAENT